MLEVTLVAFIVIFIGTVVQASIGFGLAIVAAPFLFALSPDYVPGPVTVVALLLSVMMTLKYRKSISIRGLGAAIIGRVPGSIAGGLLLLWADAKTLSLWIGLSVLLAVAVSLTRLRIRPTPWRMGAAGFLSGVMGTSTSIGGPPMALLLQHEAAEDMLSNLSAFFLVSCLLSLAVQVPAGYMSGSHLMLSLPLLPAAIIGYWVASRYAHRLPQHVIRAGSLTLCSLAGIAAIVGYWM